MNPGGSPPAEAGPTMNIREFAEHTGLTAHTLRYYERMGLMGQIGREAHGHRVYGPQDAQWVSFLHHLRETGMSIREIQRYCGLREQGDATLDARLALLEGHVEKVTGQLRSQHEHLARLRETIHTYHARLAHQGPRSDASAATAEPPQEADPARRG
jgi:DNA-binding transcriptional MerR regulator